MKHSLLRMVLYTQGKNSGSNADIYALGFFVESVSKRSWITDFKPAEALRVGWVMPACRQAGLKAS
jgi:hypothetical protein